MRSTLALSRIEFSSAPPELRAMGLLGWVSVVVNGALHLDGLTVRRTLDSRTVLSFPEHRRRGRVHSGVRPTGAHARRDVEAQVLGELRRRGDVP